MQNKSNIEMNRIGNLPDSVLSHILSLLPTKLAASTCVLSKRWQFLWTMIHNLDLECMSKTQQLQKCRLQTNWLRIGRACRNVMSFVNIVNKFFTVRDKDLCIKKFRLIFVSSSCSRHVGSWVLAAIASGVEELDLELCLPTCFQHSPSIGDYYLFRCSMFTCKTLVTLKLNDIAVDAPQSSVYFPSLKVLHLLTVNFANGLSFSNLFYGCPVLENLILIESKTTDIEDLEGYAISSPTLRELVIELCSIRLLLEAPSLEYLNLDVYASTNIYLKNLGNLVEAVVYLNANPVSALTIQDSEVEILHVVEHAFAALHNVQNLRLKEFTMEALFMGKASFEIFSVFRNLVLLELEDFCCFWPTLDFCCFWPMLSSLLRKLPHLQHLTLYLECQRDCDFLGSEAWADLDALNCLSHLRTFCFCSTFGWEDNSDRYRHNIGFLTYVLKYSTVLEKTTITCFRDTLISEQKRVISKKLASLERGSKKCQLEFEGEVL